MKNLPDDELFDKLRVRLQNFREDPDDDVWTGINDALRPSAAAHSRNRHTLILILMLMSLGSGYLMPSNHSHDLSLRPSALPSSASLLDGQKDDDDDDSNNRDAASVADEPVSSSPTKGEGPPLIPKANSQPQFRQMHRSSVIEKPLLSMETGSSRAAQLSQGIPDSSNVSQGAVDNGTEPTSEPLPSGELSALSYIQEQLPVSSLNQEQRSVISKHQRGQVTDSSNCIQRSDSVVVAARTSSIPLNEGTINEKSQKRQSRWRVYAMMTPSLTFHHVTPSTSDDPIFAKLNSPGVISSERLSYSFEGGIQFPIARRLHAFAGLTYYHQSTDLSLEQITSGTSVSSGNSLDFNFQPNTTTTTINYRMHNIGVTSGLSYVISVGKIIHQLGGALQYEYGLVGRSTDENDQTSDNFVNFRIFYRAEYSLNARLSLFVQPTLSRSLISDDVMNGALQVKQSRAGIGIGVLYRIK